MKGLIAAAILALPFAGTALLAKPASAEIIIRGQNHPTVVAQTRRVQVQRRVWVAGHWDYTRRNRVWVPGHYEYRR